MRFVAKQAKDIVCISVCFEVPNHVVNNNNAYMYPFLTVRSHIEVHFPHWLHQMLNGIVIMMG